MGETGAFLKIDWDGGEQPWKFWISPYARNNDGHDYRFKFLSKRLANGCFEAVAVIECDDGSKSGSDPKLIHTAKELDADAKQLEKDFRDTMDPNASFEVQDFTRCKTVEEWDYMLREGTVNRIREG